MTGQRTHSESPDDFSTTIQTSGIPEFNTEVIQEFNNLCSQPAEYRTLRSTLWRKRVEQSFFSKKVQMNFDNNVLSGETTGSS